MSIYYEDSDNYGDQVEVAQRIAEAETQCRITTHLANELDRWVRRGDAAKASDMLDKVLAKRGEGE